MKPGKLFLEQYKLGELTDEEKKQFEDSFEDPNELERLLRELDDSDKDFFKKFPVDETVDSIKERSEQSKGSKILKFPVFRISALAAAAAVVIFGFSFFYSPVSTGGTGSTPDVNATERIKGMKPSLKIYRSLSGSAEILENRDTVAEKDLLQIEYIAGGYRYGMIFSIDGRGTVTMHYPSYSGIKPELDNNGAVLLPYAYELDDAPEFERFFFIAGGDWFNADEVLDAAYELASSNSSARRSFLDIPEEYYQTTILLKKGAER